MSNSQIMPEKSVYISVILAIIFVIVACMGTFLYMGQSIRYADAVSLPILVIGGAVVLLAALSGISLSFAYFRLSNEHAALALPPGSIRAVLALMLLVLFAILVIYLYGSLSSDPISSVPNLDEQAKSGLEDRFRSSGTLLSTVQTGNTYTVYYFSQRNQVADDFAKQVLVLMGTLVTSIASFYFGTKATAGEVGPASRGASSPAVTSISPTKIEGDNKPHQVTFGGSGLGGVVKLEIVKGDERIAGTDLEAHENMLVANFVASATQKGTWDVVLTDASGDVIRTARQLEVE